MKTTAAFAFVVLVLWCTSIVSAVTIDLVTVGNLGNAPDTRNVATGLGSVGYLYQIDKYEVTAGQYTEFLNDVAKDDPNGLYNPSMGNPGGALGANIQRSGSSPSYSYSVAADWADRPVNWVSFWDAARFANWLDNGQPTGAQGPATTEDGAYLNVGNQATFARQPGAKFFIPTEDEWYKAAYHNNNAGLVASYFDYPTGTNAVPGMDISETTNSGNNANYSSSNYAIGSPYYRTVAGEFELSDSPYGTFDQGGNVWEWNETAVNSSSRGLRGGSFDVGSPNMNASTRSYGFPAYEDAFVGFRVASTPLLTGDYNGDGIVDAADYVVWRKTDSSPAGYATWRAHFGQPAGGGSGAIANATIPEPSTRVLGAIAGLSLLLRKRALR